jgi:hypothetical protein
MQIFRLELCFLTSDIRHNLGLQVKLYIPFGLRVRFHEHLFEMT